jgi:hypothetical protein
MPTVPGIQAWDWYKKTALRIFRSRGYTATNLGYMKVPCDRCATLTRWIERVELLGKLDRQVFREEVFRGFLSSTSQMTVSECITGVMQFSAHRGSSWAQRQELVLLILELHRRSLFGCAAPPEILELLISPNVLFDNQPLLRESAVDAIAEFGGEASFPRALALERCVSDVTSRLKSRTSIRDDRKLCGSEALLGYPDAEGWGSLETSLKAICAILASLSISNLTIDLETVSEPIFACISHTNRFAREQAQSCLGQLIRLSGVPSAYDWAAAVGLGLDDNWSQVRYAALTSCRQLVRNATRSGLIATITPLIPGLLLNRHYVAEGVKRYAQETWKILVGPSGGLSTVRAEIIPIMEYLGQSMDSLNHSTREAAISCLFELLRKMPGDHERKLNSSVLAKILRICLTAIQDDAWPVREVANECVAVLYGTILKEHDAECREALLLKLVDLFHFSRMDVFGSVVSLREECSRAIWLLIYADANCKGGHNLWSACLEMLRNNISAWRNRASESHGKDHIHENQPMFSCGSLVSNSAIRAVKHSLSDDCCANHCVSSVLQPWERSDGAFRLAQLCIDSSWLDEQSRKTVMEICAPSAIGILGTEGVSQSSVLRTSVHKFMQKAESSGFSVTPYISNGSSDTGVLA